MPLVGAYPGIANPMTFEEGTDNLFNGKQAESRCCGRLADGNRPAIYICTINIPYDSLGPSPDEKDATLRVLSDIRGTYNRPRDAGMPTTDGAIDAGYSREKVWKAHNGRIRVRMNREDRRKKEAGVLAKTFAVNEYHSWGGIALLTLTSPVLSLMGNDVTDPSRDSFEVYMLNHTDPRCMGDALGKLGRSYRSWRRQKDGEKVGMFEKLMGECFPGMLEMNEGLSFTLTATARDKVDVFTDVVINRYNDQPLNLGQPLRDAF